MGVGSVSAPAEEGKRWKGLLASLLFSGAGQYLAGRRLRGAVWAAAMFLAPTLFFVAYAQPFMPGRAGLYFFVLLLFTWLAMLRDSLRPVRRLRWWFAILLLVASLLISTATSQFVHSLYKAYRVPTGAMIPTLNPGDLILTSNRAYKSEQPRRGDIVVFTTRDIGEIARRSGEPETIYVKRVVGLPGDRLEISDATLRVNGIPTTFGDPEKPLQYFEMGKWLQSNGSEPYSVPENCYFVLGDNSRNSYDSRFWGPIRREAILGRVTKIYWPWSRASTPR